MSYTWDAMNRLKLTSQGAGSGRYTYRLDGLLAMKVVVPGTSYTGSGYGDFNEGEDNPTYFYRYDGQMQFEEEALVDKRRGSAPYRNDVTRHTLGARVLIPKPLRLDRITVRCQLRSLAPECWPKCATALPWCAPWRKRKTNTA